MRPLPGLIVAAEVPPTRDTEFAECLITECLHYRLFLIKSRGVFDNYENINDGLGIDGRDGCAANMMYDQNSVSESMSKLFGLLLKRLPPMGIMGEPHEFSFP